MIVNFSAPALLIALATVASTFLGGMFAIRFKDKLHLVLGFSAGAVLGVAFFDLLPEAINLKNVTSNVSLITTITASGFLFFMLLDRLLIFHVHHEEGEVSREELKLDRRRGKLGALSLSLHSFLDGTAIGLGFQVSGAVGVIVAAAVLTHDFSDGINTVGLVLKNRGSRTEALKWLMTDALAPIVGVVSTFFYTLSSTSLAYVLAVFCGFFLYIGASDLLPESHHRHPARWTSLMTVIGAALVYMVVKLAQLK